MVSGRSIGHARIYPTSKVSTAIPLTLCSAHLTLVRLEKVVLLSRAAVPSPIEKVYIPLYCIVLYRNF